MQCYWWSLSKMLQCQGVDYIELQSSSDSDTSIQGEQVHPFPGHRESRQADNGTEKEDLNTAVVR